MSDFLTICRAVPVARGRWYTARRRSISGHFRAGGREAQQRPRRRSSALKAPNRLQRGP